MSSPSTFVIRPRRGWVPIDFAELWHYRELAFTLAAREVLVRYKQSVLGVAWAIIQPVVTMVIFTMLFSVLLGQRNMPAPEGVPYAVSTYCALLPWQLFSQSVTRASLSIVTNQNLITKVYFPRLIIPLAPVLAALIDFGIAFIVLIGMMIWYGITPGAGMLMLPLFVLLALAAAFAFSLWLSALNVTHRDIQHVVPFLVQVMMYLSPILYSAESVLANRAEWIRLLYWMNPMTGVAEGFRWALLGAPAPAPGIMACSIAAVGLFLVSGMYFFKRIERQFADVV